MSEKQLAVRLKGISKSFGPVKANQNVSFDIYRGEVLALLGENGSGKTTLMNMLSGIYFPDSGEIEIDGKHVSIGSPRDAFDYGIGMIHQHFKLINVFTAAENIVLGLKEDAGFDLNRVKARVAEICDEYGFVVDPDKKVYDMSVSEKQTVEIVKALYRGADILILDEPTAVLTPQETEKLFAVLRNMRDDGKAVVIITHKLQEVSDISDRVVVLRKGEYVGEMITAQSTADQMTEMMVGHAVKLNIERPPIEEDYRMERIRVEHLTVRGTDGLVKVDDVSFSAYTGEILGIAGISGSGQRELLESIAGLTKVEEGSVTYFIDENETKELIGMDSVDIRNMGVMLSFVPEDRLGMGLVSSMDLTDNMMLRSFRNTNTPFTDRSEPRHLAEVVVEALGVDTPSINTPVGRLAGGNVQKVLVGREIAAAPTVLMSAYAVRGLDVNSSYVIYDLLNMQKQNGVCVMYVGEDLDVLLELCDRILVLCAGKVSGIVDGRTTSKNEVGLLMTKVGGGDAA